MSQLVKVWWLSAVLWFYIKIKILSTKTEFTAQNSYIYKNKKKRAVSH